MRDKKQLTPKERENLAMKYEIAEELGLLDKVREAGWKGLTSRESGKIGGIMGRRKRERRENREESTCNKGEESI